jgi:hypothetical protein
VAYTECGDIAYRGKDCTGDQHDGYQNGYKVVIFLFHCFSPMLGNPNDWIALFAIVARLSRE